MDHPDDDQQIQGRPADWLIDFPAVPTTALLDRSHHMADRAYCLTHWNCSHVIICLLNYMMDEWRRGLTAKELALAKGRRILGIGKVASVYARRTWPILIFGSDDDLWERNAKGIATYEGPYTTPGHVQSRSIEIAQMMGVSIPQA
ncbi:hypothetical protein ACIP9H_39275 [Streptomyces sp. NPDC088732]|uniref:hypothetical protein n=1 Tax=Streptomyces sp. NPDC088732 TaxID=3365879 RepID=UPI00380BB90E